MDAKIPYYQAERVQRGHCLFSAVFVRFKRDGVYARGFVVGTRAESFFDFLVCRGVSKERVVIVQYVVLQCQFVITDP
jgi:hypothetical protein